MKIDAHHHFWHYVPREFGWIPPHQTELQRDFLPEHFAPELASAGLDGSIVIQARQSLEETQWLLDLADQHSFVYGVVGWVDLCSSDVEAQLLSFVRHPKLVGVRHVLHAEAVGFLRRRSFRHGLSVLASLGLVYELLIFPRHLPAIVELVKEFPTLTFVLDHLAKPWVGGPSLSVWRDQLNALARLPNVYAKLSGLVPEGDVPWSKADRDFCLEAAAEAFGEDRLMLASNWPVCLSESPYQEVLDLVLNAPLFSAVAKQKIRGENAARVYGARLRDHSDQPAT